MEGHCLFPTAVSLWVSEVSGAFQIPGEMGRKWETEVFGGRFFELIVNWQYLWSRGWDSPKGDGKGITSNRVPWDFLSVLMLSFY